VRAANSAPPGAAYGRKVTRFCLKDAMADFARIGATIGSIHSAALDPKTWSDVLRQVSAAVGGENAILFTPDTAPGRDAIWVGPMMSAAVINAYIGHYVTTDLWTISVRERCRSGAVYTDPMLVNPRVFANSEFYNDFLKPLDFARICGCVLFDGSVDGLPRTHLSVYRAPGAKAFPESSRRALIALTPHLQTAIRTQKVIGDQQRHLLALTSAIDALGFGIIALGSKKEVIHANRPAQELLAAASFFRMDGGVLAGASDEHNRRLCTMVATVLRTGTASALMLRTASGAAINLVAYPFARRQEKPGVPDLLLVISSSAAAGIGEALLQMTYGLSKAEARLAAALGRGQSLTSAATSLDITVNTARSVLKTIFAKTGVRRQAELVHLLMSWPSVSRR